MKKTKIALSFIILLLLISMFQFYTLSTANPIDSVSIPSIQISSPLPFPLNKYENSTVRLEIYVNMFIDSPKLSSVSYSLDGKPLVHLDNLTVKNFYDFGADKIDFTMYTASTILEGLSEGNHTVAAYSGDMSVSRNFRVNSYYQVTVIKVLSPTNQTYAAMVPLLFTVNGEVKEAHYYLYKGYESVFEKSFNGNTTLDNLANGNYSLYLYVTTEYGEASAATYFTISKNNHSENPATIIGITAIVVFVIIIIGLFACVRKCKHRVKQQANATAP
jgi:hypothetical protein